MMRANPASLSSRSRPPQTTSKMRLPCGEYRRHAADRNEDRWNEHYWEGKVYTDELVRASGFTYWTVIRPAFFMENFVRPSYLFANWVEDRLVTTIAPDTGIALVAVQDIGSAAAASIDNPDTFNKVVLELAGDYLTMTDIAKELSDALGTEIEATSLSPAEALAQGLVPEFVASQERMNDIESMARPEQAHDLGLTTTDFKTWANRNLRPAA